MLRHAACAFLQFLNHDVLIRWWKKARRNEALYSEFTQFVEADLIACCVLALRMHAPSPSFTLFNDFWMNVIADDLKNLSVVLQIQLCVTCNCSEVPHVRNWSFIMSLTVS